MPPKTFEQIAIENGLVTEAEVAKAREKQRAEGEAGAPARRIDQILVADGALTEAQSRAIRTALGRLKRDASRREPVRIGGYEIIEKIGDGGLGVVYRARQLSMGRSIALKVLHKKWLRDEEFKKRFLLEAKLAGRLSHQNLIQVYDVGREKGTYYFSMEFVDGETVEDMIERRGALPVPVAVDITLQILRAVEYIKKFDIVHRDIKPGNIMMTKTGVAKLGDFGFVKSRFDALLATDGEVLGTPDYISPEQAMGSEVIDWRSDVYSLGCSLYHMLVGAPPFDGSGSDVMKKHIRSELPDPRTIRPDLGDNICLILERMLAKNPEDRYASTAELFEDLEMVKLGQDPKSPPLDAGKSTIIRAFKIERSRRHRAKGQAQALEERIRKFQYMVLGLMALVAILIVLVLFLFVRDSSRTSDEPPPPPWLDEPEVP